MKGNLTALVTAAAFALSALASNVALAQEKKGAASNATIKVLQENEKVRVFETSFAPGAENKAIPTTATRVVRVLKGGTLERTYGDGKKEKLDYKTGQVLINQPSPAYTTKNIGKTEVQLYVVQLK